MNDDIPSQPKIFGMGVLWLVGILGVMAAVTAGLWGWNYVTASTAGKVQARQQIQSGNYRIAAYDHFFNLCASVQTADDTIASQMALLAQTPQDDNSDRQRILTNIGGLEATRADGINQYNADAAKSYTVGQFRSSNLPYQLPNAPYQKGEHITCTS